MWISARCVGVPETLAAPEVERWNQPWPWITPTWQGGQPGRLLLRREGASQADGGPAAPRKHTCAHHDNWTTSLGFLGGRRKNREDGTTLCSTAGLAALNSLLPCGKRINWYMAPWGEMTSFSLFRLSTKLCLFAELTKIGLMMACLKSQVSRTKSCLSDVTDQTPRSSALVQRAWP